jgi:hypothetical protein
MEKRSPSPFLTADSATETFPASDGRASNWRKGAADLRRLSLPDGGRWKVGSSPPSHQLPFRYLVHVLAI